MIVARPIVLLLMIASWTAAMGQAAATCPWLASGTAARLLGGDVTVVARVESRLGTFAGSCRFVRLSGEPSSSVEVLVGSTDTHVCPQGSVKLRALGNEAVQCRLANASAGQSDIVAGRIRDVYFVVTLTNVPGATTQEPADPRLADAYGASPLERVAEQVVGNLY
jgi:hypothetical protein